MVTIRVAEGRLELRAPYHPALPFRSKQIGGKWLGPETGWVFPLEEEQALRRVWPRHMGRRWFAGLLGRDGGAAKSLSTSAILFARFLSPIRAQSFWLAERSPPLSKIGAGRARAMA